MGHREALNEVMWVTFKSNEDHVVLEQLCWLANKFHNEEWSKWLGELTADAESLLDRIDATRTKEKKAGTPATEIDAAIRYLKESAKPSRKTLNKLSRAVRKYEGATLVVSLDPERCQVTESIKHSSSAPASQRAAFALVLAIRDGYWQFFRKCREPKCGKFFFDHMERGRPAARYCCQRHRDAHRKRIQRGSA